MSLIPDNTFCESQKLAAEVLGKTSTGVFPHASVFSAVELPSHNEIGVGHTKTLYPLIGGQHGEEREFDEPFWFDAADTVSQYEPSEFEACSQNWIDADGISHYYRGDAAENDQVDADFSFPETNNTLADKRPSSHQPEQIALDDSYDVISGHDVETLDADGGATDAAFLGGLRSRTTGFIPASSRMLKSIIGLKSGNGPPAEIQTELPIAQHSSKNGSVNGSPIRAFLRKHLTASSPAASAGRRREAPMKATGSPGALRRRGPSKEAAVSCRSGSPTLYHTTVASNSIVSQCMSLDPTFLSKTENKMYPSFPPSNAVQLQTSNRGGTNSSGGKMNGSHRTGPPGVKDGPHRSSPAVVDSELFDNNNPLSNPGDAVKVRLQSIWNNVKYGWTVKPRTSFSQRQPLWLLGECHKLTEERELVSSGAGGPTLNLSGIEKFRQDFLSRLWFTYRRDFVRLPKDAPPACNATGSALPPSGSSTSTQIYPHLSEINGMNNARMPSHSAVPASSSSAGNVTSEQHQRAFSTDCGWGCMLRSGQMLLAQALVDHFLGRQWRWLPPTAVISTAHAPRSHHEPNEEDFMHRQIIRWCSDSPDSPFSLHSLVNVSRDLGRKPGDWFGPATLAVLMKKALVNVHYAERLAPNLLTTLSPQSLCRLQQLQIYVARDGTISNAEIDELCTRGYVTGDIDYESVVVPLPTSTSGPPGYSPPTAEWKYSLVVFIPALLGASRLNKMYIHCLEEFLSLPQCCGIIGGRPRHSLYFIGYQTPYLIYLDPHYCQKAVDTSPLRVGLNADHARVDAATASFPLDSFHCCSPRKMPYSKMDPSCTIGFYVRTRSEFETLQRQLTEIQKNVCQGYPIFCFTDRSLGGSGLPRTAHETEVYASSSEKAAGGVISLTARQPFGLLRDGTGRRSDRQIDGDTEIDSGFVIL